MFLFIASEPLETYSVFFSVINQLIIQKKKKENQSSIGHGNLTVNIWKSDQTSGTLLDQTSVQVIKQHNVALLGQGVIEISFENAISGCWC